MGNQTFEVMETKKDIVPKPQSFGTTTTQQCPTNVLTWVWLPVSLTQFAVAMIQIASKKNRTKIVSVDPTNV